MFIRNKNGSSQLAWDLNSIHKIYRSTQNLATNLPSQNDLNPQTEDEEDISEHQNKRNINDSLVNYLISSNLPMSMVNNESFKQFIKNLSPEYA